MAKEAELDFNEQHGKKGLDDPACELRFVILKSLGYLSAHLVKTNTQETKAKFNATHPFVGGCSCAGLGAYRLYDPQKFNQSQCYLLESLLDLGRSLNDDKIIKLFEAVFMLGMRAGAELKDEVEKDLNMRN